MAVIAIPKPLRDKLGDEGTDAFVQIVKEIDSSARLDTLGVVEERFERRLSEENAKTNNRITEEVGRLDKRITEESGKLRLEIEQLRVEIAKSRAEIIKWMFIFWCGQIGATFAIIKLLMK